MQPDSHAVIVEASVLDEAAEWMVRQQSGDLTAAERLEFEIWRRRSVQHAQAWQRAEAIIAAFGSVPSQVGNETLRRLRKSSRRDTLQLLGAAMIGAPVALLAWRELPWREWSADFQTATGEQKHVELADGTQLVLNTASAVDVTMTTTDRRLRLHAGEVLITTATDTSPAYGPFVVQTAQGTVRALGTQFCVRQRDGSTQVAVFESAVEIRPRHGVATRLQAGERTRFSAQESQTPQATDITAAAWEHGMLVARNMHLGELISELARYRPGVLRCDPVIADLPVSGAFSVRDTDASLALLQKTLPVQINARTRYWLTLEPRSATAVNA